MVIYCRYERFGQDYNFFFPYATFLLGEIPNRNLISYCITNEIGCPYKHESPNNIADEILGSSVIIYPNPASEQILITAENHEITEVQIYSLDGRLMQSQEFSIKNNYQIEFKKSIQSGIYLLSIQALNGATTLNKVMILKE